MAKNFIRNIILTSLVFSIIYGVVFFDDIFTINFKKEDIQSAVKKVKVNKSTKVQESFNDSSWFVSDF